MKQKLTKMRTKMTAKEEIKIMMKFKKGDKVIYSGHEAVIVKALPNSLRYRINTKYCENYLVDSRFLHEDMRDCIIANIQYVESMVISQEKKLENTKNLLKKWEDRLISYNSQIMNSQQIRSNSVQDDRVGDTVKGKQIHKLIPSLSADTSNNTKKVNEVRE